MKNIVGFAVQLFPIWSLSVFSCTTNLFGESICVEIL